MKKTKTQSGITLVALIITIIVLLILAIVSIRAIQQGGIIGKAQNSVDSYTKIKEEENTINEYENFIDQNDPEKKKQNHSGITYEAAYKAVYSGDSMIIVLLKTEGISKVRLYTPESGSTGENKLQLLEESELIENTTEEYNITISSNLEELSGITFNLTNDNSRKVMQKDANMNFGTAYVYQNYFFADVKEDNTTSSVFTKIADFDFNTLS